MDGTVGETNLVEYGIQTEDSDLRVHVCPVAGKIYVYPTKCGLRAIQSGAFKPKPGYQTVNGHKTITAMGYPIPPSKIERCIDLEISPLLWARYDIRENDLPSEKGRKATALVQYLIKWGWFSLPGNAVENRDFAAQVAGSDLVVRGVWKLQIKCDYKGGEYPGTGNLYLQTSGWNPNGYK